MARRLDSVSMAEKSDIPPELGFLPAFCPRKRFFYSRKANKNDSMDT